jgi:hypothetical protein
MSDNFDSGTEPGKNTPKLFGLFGEDSLVVDRLRASVRTLIKRAQTTPEQIFNLAKLLYALERLPLPTEGIGIELSLSMHHANGERTCQEITLDGSSFRLSTGAWIIIEPSIGGDSEGETVFEVEIGGFREVAEPAPMVVMDWLDAFDQRVGDLDQKLQISDSADSSCIDWDAESGEAYWDNLDSDYV